MPPGQIPLLERNLMSRRLSVLLGGVLAGFLVAGAALAAESFTVAPTSGPAGTTIHVSSADACDPPDGVDDPNVEVLLVDDDDVLVEDNLDVNDAGGFAGTLTVPADADPGALTVAAACFDGDEEEPFRELAEQAFTVTAAGGGGGGVGSTTTTTTEPSNENSPKPKLEPAGKGAPAATAAKPVVGQPRFTG